MASYDPRKASATAAGRNFPMEFSSVTGAGNAVNVALVDRAGLNVFGEDMIFNVFDTSTSPWTDLRVKFAVTSVGNIQNTVDAAGNTHTLLVIWQKRHTSGLG